MSGNGFAITVEFRIRPDDMAAFVALVCENAAQSVAKEQGCRHFHVLQAEDTHDLVTLYEVYADRASFDLHLESPHFRMFDDATRPMVVSKTVSPFFVLADGHS